MLIKIDGERFINSDHLILIDHDERGCILYLTDHEVKTSSAVVTYIAEVLDASNAFTDEAISPLSLDSRIAICLRNMVEGLDFADICKIFKLEAPAEVNLALARLVSSNVVKALATNEPDTSLYFHASNPMFQAGKNADF